MAASNSPEPPQPEPVEFNLFKSLKKEYGETAARTATNRLPVKVHQKEIDFFAFLSEKIPVKSHFLEIFQREATRDFLVSEFLSQYGDSEKPKEPEAVFTAKELLEKIDYSLFKIEDVSEILDFTHFYKNEEVICTMKNAKQRFDHNHIFFLTHKNAANIPHANDLDKNNLTPEWEHYLKKNGITDINGITPQREDPYGTSILSVQINIETGTVLKIINRYNHSVTEPDVTFGGDLNMITPGLEQAIYGETPFKKPPDRKHIVEIPANLLAHDGKFYFYTQERAGVYWGDGFVYNNGIVTVLDTDSERVVDGYILSSKKRKPSPLPKGEQDPSPFSESYQEPYLEGIRTVKFPSKDTIEVVDNQGKKATLKTQGGCLVSFHSDELTEVGDNFFHHNRTLTSLSIPNLSKTGNNFFRANNSLTFLSLANLEEVKDGFFESNNSITFLSLDNLKIAGDYFFHHNNSLTSLSLDNLKIAGSYFFHHNNSITFLSLANLKVTGDYFFASNNSLTSLSLNNLKIVGSAFFSHNESITSLSLDNLEEVKDGFFYSNNSITSLSLNTLEKVGDYFFYSNNTLTSLSLNNLKIAGNYFFYYNNSVVSLSLNNLEEVGDYFFASNNSITFLTLNNLKIVESGFFYYNNSVTSLSLNNLEELGDGFFGSHESFKHLFPKDFSNGICVSLEKKEELKNIQSQEIQETVPSNAPSNGTFQRNLPNSTAGCTHITAAAKKSRVTLMRGSDKLGRIG